MFISRKLIGPSAALLSIALFAVVVWYFVPDLLRKQTSQPESAPEDFPVFIRTNGGLLEVGKVAYEKTYKLKNSIIVMGRRLPFCSEQAEVMITPNITYRIRLAKRWVAEYSNKTLYVTTPALEPSLPVAFDTSGLSEQLTKCWFMMSMNTRQDLLRSLSSRLEKEAKASSRIDFARDHGARDTVREFVQKWLLTQKGYNIPPNTRIDVTFADE